MSEWILRIRYTGSRTVEELHRIEEDFTHQGYDASTSVQPQLGQWTVTLDGHGQSLGEAVDGALTLAAKFVGDEQPVAVESLTFAEYERMADEATLPVLVGASEAGELLGVSRQRVHQLRSLPGFPAPLVEVAMGPLWDERAMRAFERGWTRKPGRPAKASV